MNASSRYRGKSRRVFLLESSVAFGAISAGMPLAGKASTMSRNDTIGIGFIGVGSRASTHLGEMLEVASRHNVRIAGLCDVWKKAVEAASARVEKATSAAPFTCSRYQDLLARPDIDAVVIATPDFSHGTILNAALEAGKDVYIEKPMTIDLDSANRALDQARAGHRVVQAGTQRRSDGHFRAGAATIASGALGKISRVSAQVNFNEPRWKRDTSDCVAADVDWQAFLLDLPDRPFDAKLLRQWQIYKETSNGMPGLWMTHYADSVHLLTGATSPRSATAAGGIYVWNDGREHADTFHALLEYPEGFLFDWGMGLGNAAGLFYNVCGTEATLDAERWTIAPEKTRNAQPAPIEPAGGESHLENWLNCLRSRETPNADIMAGHQHVVATVMAAQAFATGRRVTYDAESRSILAG